MDLFMIFVLCVCWLLIIRPIRKEPDRLPPTLSPGVLTWEQVRQYFAKWDEWHRITADPASFHHKD